MSKYLSLKTFSSRSKKQYTFTKSSLLTLRLKCHALTDLIFSLPHHTLSVFKTQLEPLKAASNSLSTALENFAPLPKSKSHPNPNTPTPTISLPKKQYKLLHKTITALIREVQKLPIEEIAELPDHIESLLEAADDADFWIDLLAEREAGVINDRTKVEIIEGKVGPEDFSIEEYLAKRPRMRISDGEEDDEEEESAEESEEEMGKSKKGKRKAAESSKDGGKRKKASA